MTLVGALLLAEIWLDARSIAMDLSQRWVCCIVAYNVVVMKLMDLKVGALPL